jgi:hypothetical protein
VLLYAQKYKHKLDGKKLTSMKMMQIQYGWRHKKIFVVLLKKESGDRS